MKNGDLSNTSALTIAFRCEDLLVKFKNDTIKDKLLNSLIGKIKRAEIDEKVSLAMGSIYRNTEYSVDLVVCKSNFTNEMEELLDSQPFNRIVFINKETEISQRLLTGDISLYVDNDEYRRGVINSKYAISLDDLSKYIKIPKPRRII